MKKKAVIFDLDGVIVTTDKYHYNAWKKLVDEEGIFFNHEINEGLRGVSRMESLEIILEKSSTIYSEREKADLAERKNDYYRKSLDSLTPDDILPGVLSLLAQLKEKGIKTAIGSSSKNTAFILEKTGLQGQFDAVADGNGIKRSKPDPEVFLLAARLLETSPQDCVVVEDAEAGIEAALAAGMKAVGICAAAESSKAHYTAKDLSSIIIEKLL